MDNKSKLLSFHGDPKIKEAHIARLKAHYDADEFIQGKFWENGKGCDTGCAFHSSDFNQWPLQLGIPLIIGKIRERIFEKLPNHLSKEFPMACSMATPVGVDLDPVWRKLMLWILIDEKHGVLQYAKQDDTIKAIKDVAEAYAKVISGTPVPVEIWIRLRNDAYKVRSKYYYSAAAEARYYSARDGYYVAISEKLIELLKEAA